MKRIFVILMVVVLFSFSTVVQSFGVDRGKPVPKMNQMQEIGFAYLKTLKDLPAQGGENMAAEINLKNLAARHILYCFAGCVKDGKVTRKGDETLLEVKTKVSRQDTMNALNILFSSEVYVNFADFCGDNNGMYTIEEVNKLTSIYLKSIGLKLIRSWYLENTK